MLSNVTKYNPRHSCLLSHPARLDSLECAGVFNNMKKEIWKDVVGYEGLYQVSNRGQIRSLDKKVRNRYGAQIKRGKILKNQIGKRGYMVILLYKENKPKAITIHRLVCTAFNKNTENKPQVNHKDGNRFNNNSYNLEWVTQQENIKHAWENKLMNPKRGEGAGNSKLTEKNVIKIRSLLQKGKTQTKIALLFNCSGRAISDINVGRTWKHIK